MTLTLNKFGKFKNKEFEISNALTLFYGENESGKTTIFDALMLLFSEDKKTSSFHKQIKARYGEDIDISIDPDIPPSIKLHPQSYNNLYAIRQSEIIFEMSDSKDSKDWESEIKKKLFSSDIDIGKIAAEVRAECSSKAKDSIPSVLESLKRSNDKAKEELDSLYVKAGAELSKRKKLKELDKSISYSENIKRQKTDEVKRLGALIESKKEAKLKSEKHEIIKTISEYNKDKELLSKNKTLKEDYSKPLNECKSKIDKAEKSIPSLKAKIEILEKEKSRDESLKARINKAISDLEELQSSSAATAAAKKRKFPKIALLAIAALLSVLLSVCFKSPYWLLLMLLAVPFMLIKEKKAPLLADPAKPIRDILDSLPEIESGNIEDNENASAVKAFVKQRLTELEEEGGKKDDEIASLQEELSSNEKILEDCAKEQDNIFKALSVTNMEDYYKKKSEYDAASKRSEERLFRLASEAKRLGLPDIETLEADCYRVLKDLDEKGVNPQDYNEMEMRRLQNDEKSLNDEIREIESNINSANNEKSRILGGLESADNVHDRIVELESQIEENEEHKKDLTKKQKALGVLQSMLSKMSESNDAMFSTLSGDAKSLYNSITGKALSDDAIAMSGFDKAKILVKDKQNETRSVEMLSSGTRDAVYISMRLSILAKVHESGRIMLLDDPFITFDPERLREALTLIREYSKKYNIPVVIFTKDTFTKDIISSCKEATVHELS